MIVTISKSDLSSALSIVNRSVSTRSTLPILGYINLEAIENELILSSTDLETRTDTKIPANVKANGAICVPAKTFIDLVASLPSGEIALKFNKDASVITATCVGNKTNIKGLPAEEFPISQYRDTQGSISVPGKLFKKALSRVAPSASKDIARPALTGVHISIKDGILRMEATDGFRADSCVIDISQYTQAECDEIVPAKPLMDIARLPGEDIQILPMETTMIFFCGKTIISIQRIEGRFPELAAVTPQKYNFSAIFNREEATIAMKQIGVIAKTLENGLSVIEFNPITSSLVFSSISSELGAAVTTIPCSIAGAEKPVKVGFSYRMLQDYFGVAESENVRINVVDPLSPTMFAPENDSFDLQHTHLQMPMIIG